MQAKLYSNLVDAIDEWIELSAESTQWPDNGIWPPDLCDMMAAAASVVFDSILKADEYAVREGFREMPGGNPDKDV